MKKYIIKIYNAEKIEKIITNNEKILIRTLNNILLKEKINNKSYINGYNHLIKNVNIISIDLIHKQIDIKFINNNRLFKDLKQRLNLFIKYSINLNILNSLNYKFNEKNYNFFELLNLFEKKQASYKVFDLNHYTYVNYLYFNDLLNSLKNSINTYDKINIKEVNYYIKKLRKNYNTF